STLRRMVEAQGGDPRVIDDPHLLPQAADVVSVPGAQAGFVQPIDALQIGTVVMDLGAGRRARGEPVDHAVGVVLDVQVGDRVEVRVILSTTSSPSLTSPKIV